jgi:CRP-like cAMP-binding protein
VRTLVTGEHFGELALLTPGGGGKRSLSIRVKSDACKLVYLDRTDFQKIVGNISQYLKMNYGGEFDQKHST